MSDLHIKRLAVLIVVVSGTLAGSLYLLAKAVPSVAGPASPAPAPNPPKAAATPSTRPKITWSQSQVGVILPRNTSMSVDLTFTSSLDISNAALEAAPQIAPFLSVQPNTFANVSAGSSNAVHISFLIASGTTLGTYDGTIHVRCGSSTLPQTLKISIAAVSQGVTFLVPQNYQVNSQVVGLGGPIALNNFGNAYLQGGIVPSSGAEIDITSVKLPSIPLMQFITNELQGSTINSTSSITVSGNAGTEVSYTDTYAPALALKNIALYVPHNDLLFKIYLTYRASDPLESQFLASFQKVLTTIQFIP